MQFSDPTQYVCESTTEIALGLITLRIEKEADTPLGLLFS